ncbi:MAG: PH domain-containing protein [Candidatus Saccharibacteria bacterium]
MDQAPNPQNPDQSKLHPMVVLQPGERVICEIKRHPFGIISMYFSGGIAIVVAVVLAALAPQFADQLSFSGNITAMATIAAGIVVIGIACMLWIASSVYWQNRWIVTDDSITQIIQASVFGRRVSQLSMENLEDITVDQQGLIQSMFNFGTLKAETAGERSKFIFPMCPNPNAYARKILEVHEAFLHQVRHQPQEVNPVTVMQSPYDKPNYPQAAPSQPSQQQPISPAPPMYETQANQPQPVQPQWPQYAQVPPPPYPGQPANSAPAGMRPSQPNQPEQPTAGPSIWKS